MRFRRPAWLPCIATASLVLSLAGCASVANVGRRVDAGGDVTVGKMQVYSMASLHSLGSYRLHRDARALDKALEDRLNAEKTEAVAADVDALVDRHRLAVEVTVADREGFSRSTALPERELLEAHRPEEQAAGTTHRLVILPLRLTLDRSTGVAHGVLRWRVEGTANDETLAVGLLRYTADARGYPAKRMASMLVAKLRALNIR